MTHDIVHRPFHARMPLSGGQSSGGVSGRSQQDEEWKMNNQWDVRSAFRSGNRLRLVTRSHSSKCQTGKFVHPATILLKSEREPSKDIEINLSQASPVPSRTPQSCMYVCCVEFCGEPIGVTSQRLSSTHPSAGIERKPQFAFIVDNDERNLRRGKNSCNTSNTKNITNTSNHYFNITDTADTRFCPQE